MGSNLGSAVERIKKKNTLFKFWWFFFKLEFRSKRSKKPYEGIYILKG